MRGQGKVQLEEILEQYISRVQGLLGSTYRYAMARGLMQEGQEDIPPVEITVYTTAKQPSHSVKNAVEVLAMDFGKRYGIRLWVVFREEGHDGCGCT